MSTHKVCFYREIWKFILKLSSDTLVLCLEGGLGEKVSLNWLTSSYFELSGRSLNV